MNHKMQWIATCHLQYFAFNLILPGMEFKFIWNEAISVKNIWNECKRAAKSFAHPFRANSEFHSKHTVHITIKKSFEGRTFFFKSVSIPIQLDSLFSSGSVSLSLAFFLFFFSFRSSNFFSRTFIICYKMSMYKNSTNTIIYLCLLLRITTDPISFEILLLSAWNALRTHTQKSIEWTIVKNRCKNRRLTHAIRRHFISIYTFILVLCYWDINGFKAFRSFLHVFYAVLCMQFERGKKNVQTKTSNVITSLSSTTTPMTTCTPN